MTLRFSAARRVVGLAMAAVLIAAVAMASGCGDERSGTFKLNPSKASSAGIGF